MEVCLPKRARCCRRSAAAMHATARHERWTRCDGGCTPGTPPATMLIMIARERDKGVEFCGSSVAGTGARLWQQGRGGFLCAGKISAKRSEALSVPADRHAARLDSLLGLVRIVGLFRPNYRHGNAPWKGRGMGGCGRRVWASLALVAEAAAAEATRWLQHLAGICSPEQAYTGRQQRRSRTKTCLELGAVAAGLLRGVIGWARGGSSRMCLFNLPLLRPRCCAPPAAHSVTHRW